MPADGIRRPASWSVQVRLVIKGARTAWLDGLLQRRSFNAVVDAVANKLARTVKGMRARTEMEKAARPVLISRIDKLR